jgi:hypothetical protein
MKYCNECAEPKETDSDTCPDCGAYLPVVKVISTVYLWGVAAVLVTILICILIKTAGSK